MNLLEGASATGEWFPLEITGSNRFSLIRTFYAWGTFGGTTVGLEVSPDGGTTSFAVGDMNGNAIALTSKDVANVIARATHVRATITGGAGMSINARLF